MLLTLVYTTECACVMLWLTGVPIHMYRDCWAGPQTKLIDISFIWPWQLAMPKSGSPMRSLYAKREKDMQSVHGTIKYACMHVRF